MKNNRFHLIKILVCLTFALFCFESVSSAQTVRRKVPAKPATTVGAGNRKAEKKAGVNAKNSQSGANKIVNPKLQPDAEVAVLETDYGAIVIELYPKLAPQMVERFKKLIREGFYDGTAFHRTSPALGIIQGGDPNSKDSDPNNDGYGKSS